MQVSRGLLCLVEQLALSVHHFVVHGDNGVFGDFHAGFPDFQKNGLSFSLPCQDQHSFMGRLVAATHQAGC
jgi:hypothetical protein